MAICLFRANLNVNFFCAVGVLSYMCVEIDKAVSKNVHKEIRAK